MITLITRTLFPPDLTHEMERLTDRSIPIFQKQKGFVSMDVLRALDGGGALTVFKWDSMTDHENCMNSEDWAELNPEWDEFLNRDEVHFEFVFTGSHWK